MKERQIQIGGQAVIEGVMMRGIDRIATAVRRKNGDVDLQIKKFVSKTVNHHFYKLIIIRGFVSLIEMLIIGIQSLNFSVNRYELDYDDKNASGKKESRFSEIMTFIFAFVIAFLLFGYVPYLLASLLNLSKQNILFNLFAGSIRIIFFVLYVWIISLFNDIKRVFEYHGAEHKSVLAHEKNDNLTPNIVQKYSTIHPRCGTSFMFFVLLVSILLFSIIDTIISVYFPDIPIQKAFMRLLIHLPFLPFISGISYEFIKLSAKKYNNFIVKLFITPGMLLQKITTQPPDLQQIEVAVISLKAALGDDLSEYKNINFISSES